MSEQEKSTEEVVKTEWEFKISKEDFEKLQEIERNKTIALKKEREESEKSKAELEELRKFKQDLEEKEAKKKWQYEELLSKKDEELKSLSEKAKLYDQLMEEQTNKIKTELEWLMSSIPSDILEEHNIFLEDLSDEKKIAYLKKISEVKKEAFDNKTEWWDTKVNTLSEYEQAKAKGDIKWMLKYAPKL